MRSSDIILQLSQKLPKFVDDFTDSVAITALVRIDHIVTATTNKTHNLKVDQSVNIIGAKTPIEIATINRVGMIATLITESDHDMTENAFFDVEISGANEKKFNGIFKLLQVKNRRTITFEVDDSGPISASGNCLLLNGSNYFQSYNGLKKIKSVPNDTSFTFEIDRELYSPAYGNIVAKTNPRISGAVTDERAIESYTRQQKNKAWLYVVMNDAIANKNKTLDINSTDNIQRSNNFKQFVSQTVSLFVFLPSSDEISGRKARDRAEELFQPICKSILFAKFDSLVANKKYNALMFNEHGFHFYNTAFYIHRYTFEMTLLLSFDDTVGYDNDVAFRDIDLTQKQNIGSGTIKSDIDLDDEML